MAETGSVKGQNFVRGETNTLELAKLGQAINLRVYRNGKMKGRLLVGHGAVGWIPRGWVKTKRKSIPWEVFATMMKEWPFGGRAQARLKFVDGALRWRSPGKRGAGCRISWAELTARLEAPMTKELKAKVAEARELIRDAKGKAPKPPSPNNRPQSKKARQLALVRKKVEAERKRLLAAARKQVETERNRLLANARRQVDTERKRLLADARRQASAERQRLLQKGNKRKKGEREPGPSAQAPEPVSEPVPEPAPDPILIAGLREAMGDMAYVSCPVENGDILRLKRPPKRGEDGRIDVSLNDKPGGWIDSGSSYWPAWDDRRLIERMVADLRSFVANPGAWIEHAWKGENRCVICGYKLTNPLSIELGIGPVCRKKHGSAAALTELLTRRATARRRAAARRAQTGRSARPARGGPQRTTLRAGPP